jgi:hypothetical protein
MQSLHADETGDATRPEDTPDLSHALGEPEYVRVKADHAVDHIDLL